MRRPYNVSLPLLTPMHYVHLVHACAFGKWIDMRTDSGIRGICAAVEPYAANRLRVLTTLSPANGSAHPTHHMGHTVMIPHVGWTHTKLARSRLLQCTWARCTASKSQIVALPFTFVVDVGWSTIVPNRTRRLCAARHVDTAHHRAVQGTIHSKTVAELLSHRQLTGHICAAVRAICKGCWGGANTARIEVLL